MADPVDQVRIAAARAIEWNCDDILIAGVRNRWGRAAGTPNMWWRPFSIPNPIKLCCIIDLPAFQDLAVKFLNSKAHPDLKKRYAELFRDKGYGELADKLAADKIGGQEKKLLVFAVDDSRMILSIYKNTLYQLGMESQLFEFPAPAIEKAIAHKPDVLLTDLNMPDITGIELTRQLRALYSPRDLPIIMVTTQSDSPDHREAYEVGVNMILSKPFTAEQVGAAIHEVLQNK